MAKPRQPRARRAPLTRDRVLDAAMRLADAEGLGALTMRRLAQDLGVEAMTLYYHVDNKDAMLAALLDRVMENVRLPQPGADWREQLRAHGISAYKALGAHPWAAGLSLRLREASPTRLAYMDAILDTLADAGFDDYQTDHAYHVIEGHIMGFTLWQVGMDLGTRTDLEALATAFLADLPVDDYPRVAEHIHHHLRPPRPDDEGSFVFGLDLILDGLERLSAATGR